MPVRIRLRRMGRKKQPHYRVVVADSLSPRDGRFVESLGYYKPLTQPARLVLDMERVEHWLSKGAEPSGTVKTLISKARRGGDQRQLQHASSPHPGVADDQRPAHAAAFTLLRQQAPRTVFDVDLGQVQDAGHGVVGRGGGS